MPDPSVDDPTIELTPADVDQYTGGRLPAAEPGTMRVLRAALSEIRKHCGWRVTPVGVDTLTLDGPGSRLLSLPTLKLVELQSITENGVVLDAGDGVPGGDTGELEISPLGNVRKKSGGCWSGRYGSIRVTLNHGDPHAWNWQAAVLEWIDRVSEAAAAGNSGPLVEKKVDDVTLRWMNTIGDPANQALFDMLNHEIVDKYRIEPL
jgi:hypothetical protein